MQILSEMKKEADSYEEFVSFRVVFVLFQN